MVLIKIITKETQLRRFKLTNFLYVLNETIINCTKCHNPIENNDYCLLCSDFDKIWHENCFDNDHIKHTFETTASVKAHADRLCVIKYLTKEVFESFEMPPIDLNI